MWLQSAILLIPVGGLLFFVANNESLALFPNQIFFKLPLNEQISVMELTINLSTLISTSTSVIFTIIFTLKTFIDLEESKKPHKEIEVSKKKVSDTECIITFENIGNRTIYITNFGYTISIINKGLKEEFRPIDENLYSLLSTNESEPKILRPNDLVVYTLIYDEFLKIIDSGGGVSFGIEDISNHYTYEPNR